MRKKLDLEDFKNYLLENKIVTSTGCWTGVGYTTTSGYRQISFNDKEYKLHRLVWIFKYGSIPINLVINHTCGNKECFNLEHLEAITRSQNALHAYRTGLKKNRHAKNIVSSRLRINDELDSDTLLEHIKRNSEVIKNKWIWKGGTSNGVIPRLILKIKLEDSTDGC